MGSIAKALSRAGYLKPVVDSLNELVTRRRQEKALQEFAQKMSGAETDVRDIFTGMKEEHKAVGTGKLSPFRQLVGGTSSPKPETLVDSLANTQPLGIEELRTEKTQVPKYTPQEQQQKSGEIIFGLMKEIFNNPDIDTQRAGGQVSALQQLANTYKPEKRELMSVGKGADIIDTKTGKKIYENLDEGKKNEYGWVTIGTGNKGGKKMVTQENKITGEKRTVEVGEEDKPGGTTVNVGTKSYGDKLGEIVQTKQEIDNIKKAKWVTKDEVLRAGYTWNGGNLGGAYIYGDKLFYTDQELNNYKEQVKTKAVGATVALLNEQGLDNAKQKIDADVSKGASYKEAYDAFVKNNPGADKEDLRILYDYIDLMGK